MPSFIRPALCSPAAGKVISASRFEFNDARERKAHRGKVCASVSSWKLPWPPANPLKARAQPLILQRYVRRDTQSRLIRHKVQLHSRGEIAVKGFFATFALRARTLTLNLKDRKVRFAPQFINKCHRVLSAESAKVSYVQTRDTRVSISKPQDNTGCPSFQLLIYGFLFPLKASRKTRSSGGIDR